MERAADQRFVDSLPFCEAAPRVKYSAPVSDEFSLFFVTSPPKRYRSISARFLILLFALRKGDARSPAHRGDSAGGQRHLYNDRPTRPSTQSRLPHPYLRTG